MMHLILHKFSSNGARFTSCILFISRQEANLDRRKGLVDRRFLEARFDIPHSGGGGTFQKKIYFMVMIEL